MAIRDDELAAEGLGVPTLRLKLIIPDATRFYFVHSYFPQPARPELVAGYSHYPFPFCCAVARGNLFAVQFHPEKSHRAGLQLLANFVRWDVRTGTLTEGTTCS